MFSLIITIIAIALVAALALATLYYGGPIFNEGADRAQAAKLSAQGQQIMGAMELYRAEKGVYPQSLNDLVADEYLKSIPVAQAEEAKALASAFAASTTWTLSSPGQPVIVLKPVSLATCKAYNQANVGMSGVLQQAHSTKLKQCVGTNVNNLMIIQPKAAADLIYVSTDPAAVVQIGAVLNTPVPTLADTTTNGWLDLVGGPVLSYSQTSLTFPTTEPGQSAAAQVVTIQNTGSNSVTFAANAAVIGAPFTAVDTTCNGAVLAPGNTCYISVGFTPSVAGDFSGGSYALQIQGVSNTLGTVALRGTAAVMVTASAESCLNLLYGNGLTFSGTQGEYEEANTSLVNDCGRPLQVYSVDTYYSATSWARGDTGNGSNYLPDGSYSSTLRPLMDVQSTTLYAPWDISFQPGDWLPGLPWWDAMPDPDYRDTAPRPEGLPSPSLEAYSLSLTVKIYNNIVDGIGERLILRSDTFSAPNSNAIPVRIWVMPFGQPDYTRNGQAEFFVRFADEPTAPFVSKVITYSGQFQN
jgi:hypothetical protein